MENPPRGCWEQAQALSPAQPSSAELSPAQQLLLRWSCGRSRIKFHGKQGEHKETTQIILAIQLPEERLLPARHWFSLYTSQPGAEPSTSFACNDFFFPPSW